ncbi:hypothetical protein PHYBOEH_003039 [Phytophthora boehmeriae]|uniref:Uncharacterized protein n=1 Tax=Phytophthora boehmeriae TaxID=109152 RepID=A0A8T1WTE2_9STRA|nr:hypothetical protein PHYBOEH_003039 [Phytophthora boehmeriae]
MKILAVFYSVGIAINAIEAAIINHDQVQAFPQPEPVTESEKAAINFKPSIWIRTGCHPYPVVNAAGDVGAGLKGSGKMSGKCKGSGLGSQVYGRAAWHNDLWAIMYSWYFPKDMPYDLFRKGRRHDWVHVVVWIDNPASANPRLIGVSTRTYYEKYLKYTPPAPVSLNGTHARVFYFQSTSTDDFHSVDISDQPGEFQGLIMWEQLTDAARTALTDTAFGEYAPVSFIDANFKANLELAWPY